jgi:voltage-gated potassium channel
VAVDVVSDGGHRPGQPRSERDAAFLKRYDTWMQVPIIVSAVLPLVIVPTSNGWVGAVVGIVTWLVFLVDYVVHVRHLVRYRRTRLGRFDLFVVVATAPWFLFPGARAGQFVVLLRLARLARLVMATRGARRLFERLGRVAAVAGGVVVVGSLVAYHAEHPTNPGFATIGDALWWGIVTLTTVGYGDIVPKTATGRWAAVMIMITGVAVLGVLAGSLASFFRLDNGKSATASPPDGDPAGSPAGKSAGGQAASGEDALRALTAEVAALRRQVEALTAQVTGASSTLASDDSADPSGGDP